MWTIICISEIFDNIIYISDIQLQIMPKYFLKINSINFNGK